MSQNSNEWYKNSKIFMIGILAGVFCAWVCMKYPFHKTAFLCIGIVAAVILLLYGVQRNSQAQFEKELSALLESLQKAKEGKVPLECPEQGSPLLQEIYQTAELMRRYLRKREALYRAASDITNSISVSLDLSQTMDILLQRFVGETDSKWGALYIYNEATQKLELKKVVGLSPKVYSESNLSIGEGTIGMAAETGKIHIYDAIPDDTVFYGHTFLGDVKPKTILTIPILCQKQVVSVAALGSMGDISQEQLELIRLLQVPAGYAISHCIAHERVQCMTKELEMQNRMIQDMNDELILLAKELKKEDTEEWKRKTAKKAE